MAAARSHEPAAGQPSMTFSVTLIAGTSMKCWWIMPMPAASAARGEPSGSGRPLNVALPASGRTRPYSTFMSVVLPEPFSPRRPTMAPAGTSRSMPRIARTAPGARAGSGTAAGVVLGGLHLQRARGELLFDGLDLRHDGGRDAGVELTLRRVAQL